VGGEQGRGNHRLEGGKTQGGDTSQYGVGWWVPEGVDLDRATKISTCEDECAVGDERKVPNSWREFFTAGDVLWRMSMRRLSGNTSMGLTARSFPDFQFQMMRPGFSIQKKMARTSSAMAMNEFVITKGRLHV